MTVHMGDRIGMFDTDFDTLCGRSKFTHEHTGNHTKVTCIHCISKMSPHLIMWHDNNNREWIEHKLKDKRRK